VEGLLGSCSGEMVPGEQWGGENESSRKKSLGKESASLNFCFPRSLWLHSGSGMNCAKVPPPADLLALWGTLTDKPVTAREILRRRVGLRCPNSTPPLPSGTSGHHPALGCSQEEVGQNGVYWRWTGPG